MPTRTAPWKSPRPKSGSRTKLTAKSIARAKAAAKKPGRRYPNLDDNMTAAREQNAGKKTAGTNSRGRSKADHP
jgi:hypothetical protein